jgi:sugar O-acyltransferase (sialic acid O-acetyltransferase NeuD family)
MKLSIIGYSGHSYVCIETALKSGFEIRGYYDIEEKLKNPYQIKYLGFESEIENSDDYIFIAIGDNQLRQIIYEKMNIKNKFATLIHPKTSISLTSIIDENVFISSGAIINAQVKIGFGCIINSAAVIEHECIIKDFVHIAPGAVLAGNVTIGKRSFIGANATIKQGVIIGDDVIVGAGSVIINDIQSNSIIVGNPGKLIKKQL